MFFILSKVLWFLVQPLSVSLLLIALALLLTFTGHVRSARTSLVLSGLILVTSAYTGLGHVALHPLESRFERPAPATDVTGIIVLGGGMDAEVNSARRGHELNRSGDRFVEALRLALHHPAARIVVSGGSGALLPGPDTESEAESGSRFFVDFGIARDRLVLEDGSRNTEENARLTRLAVDPQPGETWLLVTSAFHMPRAVGLFRKAGFDVVPWPTDYLTTGAESPWLRLQQPAENLAITTLAMREWLGLLVYWLTGRMDDLVPGPVSPARPPA